MGRYDPPQPLCNHRPSGTMSWPPSTEPIDTAGPHASTVVCDRAECRDDARQWVRAHTLRDGVFSTFAENRAAHAGQSGGAG